MSNNLNEQGLIYYNLFKNNQQDGIDTLAFRAWLAESIVWLEKRMSKSELFKIIEAVKVYSTNPHEVTFNQIEMIMALLISQENLNKQHLESVKRITNLNNQF